MKKSEIEARKKIKRLILEILEKIENKEPETIFYIDLFNTGIIVDSEQIKKLILKIIKANL